MKLDTISDERVAEITVICVIGVIFAHADAVSNRAANFERCLTSAESYVAAIKKKFGINLISEIGRRG